jgi:hypothetical protein
MSMEASTYARPVARGGPLREPAQIGNHRDNLENRIIASVSVGAERTFVMTYAPPARAPPEGADDAGSGLLREKKWVLANGSLVVMQGGAPCSLSPGGRPMPTRYPETQRYWKHAIVRSITASLIWLQR